MIEYSYSRCKLLVGQVVVIYRGKRKPQTSRRARETSRRRRRRRRLRLQLLRRRLGEQVRLFSSSSSSLVPPAAPPPPAPPTAQPLRLPQQTAATVISFSPEPIARTATCFCSREGPAPAAANKQSNCLQSDFLSERRLHEN